MRSADSAAKARALCRMADSMYNLPYTAALLAYSCVCAKKQKRCDSR